jgi:Protein of unknown function (DUF4435)
MRKQDITYQDKLNELKLDISHPNNNEITFVLVEGESDIRLFRKFFKLENCKVENIPGGKFKLEECVKDLIKKSSLLIGLRDADFLHLEGTAYSEPNMFLTDLHDMEMILISEEDVFSALIFEHTALSKDKHNEVRNNVIAAIKLVGHLKLLNDRENIEYKFEPTFKDLISFSKLEIDLKKYFIRILSKSPNAKITDLKIVEKKINALNGAGFDSLQITNGHDFIKALSQYLKESSGATVGDDEIASSLRISYNIDHFKKTKLFSDTKVWADKMKCDIFN